MENKANQYLVSVMAGATMNFTIEVTANSKEQAKEHFKTCLRNWMLLPENRIQISIVEHPIEGHDFEDADIEAEEG